MVVDDEPFVRHLTARMLRESGYTVIEVGSGEEALRSLVGADDIQLVLTDVAMPGMDGVKLADMIQHQNPAQRVMLMSAYVGVLGKLGFQGGPLKLLSKPFTAQQLQQRVKEAIG
jgi:CheY-like chemotaxis protein